MLVVERLNKPEGKFTPPPYTGHGMNESLRIRLLARVKKGINVFILVNDVPENERYGQWLDVLETSPNFLTKTCAIRIYSIEAYIKGDSAIQAALKSRS